MISSLRPVRTVVVGAAVGLLVAACGSSSSKTATVTNAGAAPTAAAPSTAAASTTTAACATTGHIGDTLCTATSAEDPLRVTLDKVTDPVTPADPNNAAIAGTRWVGFTMTVVVDGPDPDNGEPFVIGSDGKDYGFNSGYTLGNTAACTETEVNENGGSQEGKPETICPGAMVPKGVTVAKIGFSGLGTADTGTGVISWTVS